MIRSWASKATRIMDIPVILSQLLQTSPLRSSCDHGEAYQGRRNTFSGYTETPGYITKRTEPQPFPDLLRDITLGRYGRFLENQMVAALLYFPVIWAVSLPESHFSCKSSSALTCTNIIQSNKNERSWIIQWIVLSTSISITRYVHKGPLQTRTRTREESQTAQL